MADTMNPKARVDYVPNGGNIKAYCSLNLYDAVAIKGIKVMDGKNGLFVQMPQQKTSKGDYKDVTFPITKEAREQMYGAVMDAYDQHMAQAQQNAPAQDAPAQDAPGISM